MNLPDAPIANEGFFASTFAATDRLAVVRGDIGGPSDRVPGKPTKSRWKVYPRCQSPDIRYLDSPSNPTSVSR